MRRTTLLTIISLGTFFFAACTPETKPVNSPPPSPSASPVSSPVAVNENPTTGKPESLAGRWQGAEGTYLNVEKKGDKFEIEIKDLDASKKYDGMAKGDAIEFTRDGKTESITAATGDETGMKWLAGKKNCVVITKSKEGYCKD
jgi:hypothetical protein